MLAIPFLHFTTHILRLTANDGTDVYLCCMIISSR